MKQTKRIDGRVAVVCTLCALTVAWCVCDSRYNLQLTEHELRFENLPAEFDGFRVVHLTDLHGAEFGRDNSRLVAFVQEQQPDLIVMTGDMAAKAEQYDALESLLAGLEGIAPIFYVDGNHEWRGGVYWGVGKRLEKYSAKRLENTWTTLERDGASIVVAGAEDPNCRLDLAVKPEAFAKKLREENPDSFILMLGHRNYWVKRYPSLPVDLILSGHAHGGIVRLPFIGGLLSTEHTLIADYETGLYKGEHYIMEVSRGLGNSVPIPRLFNRPEVVCLTLRSGQA